MVEILNGDMVLAYHAKWFNKKKLAVYLLLS